MTHPRDDLTAFVDGALPAAEHERVAAHLAACAECREEQARLAAAVALLGRLAPSASAVSPGFERRFYQRLAAEERGGRRGALERLGFGPRAWRWFAPGLAGAVAAALVMIYAGGRHRADEAFLAEHLDLFEHYEEVAAVDAVEAPDDVQIIAHLHELRGRP